MFVDIFNVRTESEFYEKLAAEVIRQTATTFDDVLSAVKKYASAIISGLSFGDAAAPMSIQFQIREPQRCARIVELADNNPYYVQQLSQTAWLHTGDGVCTDDVVREAFEDILRQQGELNRALTATLTIPPPKFPVPARRWWRGTYLTTSEKSTLSRTRCTSIGSRMCTSAAEAVEIWRKL